MIDALHVPIDAQTRANARALVESLGDVITERYPWLPGMSPMAQDMVELVLNNTWRPTLSVTGLSGAPPVTSAGNTLRPSTSAKLSIRLPPTLDAKHASQTVKSLLETNPPYGAHVTFDSDGGQPGWAAPEVNPMLDEGVRRIRAELLRQARAIHGHGRHHPLLENVGRSLSRTRSSWSPAYWGRTRTRTGRTNFST